MNDIFTVALERAEKERSKRLPHATCHLGGGAETVNLPPDAGQPSPALDLVAVACDCLEMAAARINRGESRAASLLIGAAIRSAQQAVDEIGKNG